jgi:hypothetical protein
MRVKWWSNAPPLNREIAKLDEGSTDGGAGHGGLGGAVKQFGFEAFVTADLVIQVADAVEKGLAF